MECVAGNLIRAGYNDDAIVVKPLHRLDKVGVRRTVELVGPSVGQLLIGLSDLNRHGWPLYFGNAQFLTGDYRS